MLPSKLTLVTTSGFPDYSLLDCGGGRKLERFGKIVVDRPEPQALWQPRLAKSDWAKAHAVFSASGEDDEKGKWRIDKPVPDAWPVVVPSPLGEKVAAPARSRQDEEHRMRGEFTRPLDPTPSRITSPSPQPSPQGERERIEHAAKHSALSSSGEGGVTMLCKLSGLWHLGLFPEQRPHWQWMLDHLANINGEAPRVLNLFGYTGAASLLAAKAGAEVTHVDASKKAITWGKENQAASKLDAAKVRWILDDAGKFAAREVRRGKTYHMILVDPPKFGRGPEGEVWDLFAHLPGLLGDLNKLLAPQHAAMVLTVYAIRASALAFDQLMRDTLQDKRGTFEAGELAIQSQSGPLVPTSLFVRWTANV